jgi:myosin heavy subunit
MKMLKSTESHFIRCVKSNSGCKPLNFNSQLVHSQLLYSGVFEVVKIQQSGLPIRHSHEVFLSKFKCLVPSEYRYSCDSTSKLIQLLKDSHEIGAIILENSLNKGNKLSHSFLIGIGIGVAYDLKFIQHGIYLSI